MIDAKILNGDIVKDSAGRFVMVKDSDALFQRAVICIKTKLASFIYDRSIGSVASEVDADAELAKENVELIINEALAKFDDTYVRVLEFGEVLKIEISIGNESRTEEVRLNGNI